MPYTIIYPDSGSDPLLCRESLTSCGVNVSPVGALEPCDPSDWETDCFSWYLEHRVRTAGRVTPGTVVRIGPRTFACVREHIIAYYHLS